MYRGGSSASPYFIIVYYFNKLLKLTGQLIGLLHYSHHFVQYNEHGDTGDGEHGCGYCKGVSFMSDLENLNISKTLPMIVITDSAMAIESTSSSS